MTFLEWIITWFFADHLASKQEEARERNRLAQEINDLKAQIKGLRNNKGRVEMHADGISRISARRAGKLGHF